MVQGQYSRVRAGYLFLLFLSSSLFAAVSPVTVNVDHGFFDTAFSVTLSTATAGATIKYTLDCSDPLTSPAAKGATSPVSVVIDPQSSAGRSRTPAVVLRAVALLPPDTPGVVLTKTYLFIDKVILQENPGAPWPAPPVKDTTPTDSLPRVRPNFITTQIYDYEMDTAVVDDPRYAGYVDDALLAIPSLSLVSDMDSLFDDSVGIYENALNSGRAWERSGSVELISPGGTAGFSVNCGIRIRGGWSRHTDCPKHSFRLYFRSEYGEAKLKYPLFENEGVSSFDKICLRTSQNYSWSYKDGEGARNTMVKDVYCRDTQRDLGHYYTRSRYYHLYLNGMYWGIYQTQENADNQYAQSYMGGKDVDYDVLNTVNDYVAGSDRDKTVEVSDGTIDAAERLWTKTVAGFAGVNDYYMVQGLEPDGKTVNASYERLLDVDNLIDYMMITFYTGNFDSPTFAFSTPQRTNNFQAIYNRVYPDGFKWISHDGEHTMVDFQLSLRDTLISAIYVDRTGPFALSDDIRFFNPQRIHQELCAVSDYRMHFADHVFRHFYNKGVFCPAESQARYHARASQIDMAIIAESARWGDSKTDTARTKHDDWLPELDRIYKEYMPARSAIVVEQFRAGSLYPSVEPPVFSSAQVITETSIAGSAGYQLSMSNPNASGGMLYTVDGSDPRLPGGAASPAALQGANAAVITINTPTQVKARIKTDNEWSALRELLVSVPQDLGGLHITEIHYKPLDQDPANPGNSFEFLELKNTGKTAINLTGLSFGAGISFAFEPGALLPADSFFVIASNRVKFVERYGFAPDGVYGSQLSNDGEQIVLLNPAGEAVFSITYNDVAPWPLEPDQNGTSLVPTTANVSLDPNDGKNWTSSRAVNGSPGQDDLNSAGAYVKNGPLVRSLHTMYRVGNFSFELPAGENYKVSILNLQGKVTASFPVKDKPVYRWEPESSGLYLIRFKSVSGKKLVRRVHVID